MKKGQQIRPPTAILPIRLEVAIKAAVKQLAAKHGMTASGWVRSLIKQYMAPHTIARACFVDDSELPAACVHDIDEVHNCLYALAGTAKDKCPHWDQSRASELVKSIKGNGVE